MSGVTIEEIIGGLSRAISVVDEIIDRLDHLECEMRQYETKKNVAKTFGTTANFIGASLGIGGAFFTGGLSIVIAGVTSTVIGTATNLISDFVDMDKTKKCMEHIEKLLGEYIEQTAKIEKLTGMFHEHIDEIMRTHNIDFNTAFFLALGDKSHHLHSNDHKTILSESLSVVGLTTLEFEIMECFFGLTIRESTKAGAAVAKGFSAVAGQIIGKSVAVANVFLVGFEVVTLIKDYAEKHPTIKKTQETKHKLHHEKKKLKKVADNIKSASEAATEHIDEVLMKAKDIKKNLGQ
jgi:hypothetical protein